MADVKQKVALSSIGASAGLTAVVPENSIRRDSRGEAESAHHPMRCLRSSTCLQRLQPICSSHHAGLKFAVAAAHESCVYQKLRLEDRKGTRPRYSTNAARTRRRGDLMALLFFAAARMSASGAKRTFPSCQLMSAFGGKADIV